MNTTTTTLPKTPSALIRLALADLRAIEADDRYEVFMRGWHGPITDDRGQKVCEVCLAGAVLAKTIGVEPHERIYDDDLAGYGSSVQGALLALDYFRLGMMTAGLDMLGYDQSDHDASVAKYDQTDPDKFHSQMHRRADYLESQGL